MRSSKIILALLILLSANSRCSKEHDTNPREEKINQLTSGIWIAESVQNSADGDLTFQYEHFSIGFARDIDSGYEGTYYVTEGGRAFPDAVGRWKFSDDLKKLLFDNGRQNEISISNTVLTLEFFVAPESGRVDGVSGGFVFEMRKK